MKIWWMVYYGLTKSSQTLLAPTMDKYWFLLIQNSTSLILRKKVKSLNILIYILYTIYIYIYHILHMDMTGFDFRIIMPCYLKSDNL